MPTLGLCVCHVYMGGCVVCVCIYIYVYVSDKCVCVCVCVSVSVGGMGFFGRWRVTLAPSQGNKIPPLSIFRANVPLAPSPPDRRA